MFKILVGCDVSKAFILVQCEPTLYGQYSHYRLTHIQRRIK